MLIRKQIPRAPQRNLTLFFLEMAMAEQPPSMAIKLLREVFQKQETKTGIFGIRAGTCLLVPVEQGKKLIVADAETNRTFMLEVDGDAGIFHMMEHWALLARGIDERTDGIIADCRRIGGPGLKFAELVGGLNEAALDFGKIRDIEMMCIGMGRGFAMEVNDTEGKAETYTKIELTLMGLSGYLNTALSAEINRHIPDGFATGMMDIVIDFSDAKIVELTAKKSEQ